MTSSQHNAFPTGRWTSIPAGTDQKVITLHIVGDAWRARFTGPEEQRIRQLFGTNDICTAFLRTSPVEEVKAEIAKLNFDYTVIVESESV